MANIVAPAGYIWVCAACGKTSRDKYGFKKEKSWGWDVSCMMSACLCKEEKDDTDNWVWAEELEKQLNEEEKNNVKSEETT